MIRRLLFAFGIGISILFWTVVLAVSIVVIAL